MTSLSFETSVGGARIVALEEVRALPAWSTVFAHLAKDHRYYEIVDETLSDAFEFHYLVLERAGDGVLGIQPFFFVDQDFLATAHPSWQRLARGVRRFFPRVLRPKILMAGCAAGEGHPGAVDAASQRMLLRAAAEVFPRIARGRGVLPIVWKDIPAAYRERMPETAGVRMASMPATRLPLEFNGFDDYLQRHLSHATRKDLRRKWKATADVPLTMTVGNTLGGDADALHGLYRQVLGRAKLQFERLPREFFVQLAMRMPERARFFLWRAGDRPVACSICLLHDGILYDEYLGLDYDVALDWHLYFRTLGDVLKWAIDHGLREYRSTPLNYAPKRQLGLTLAPLDLHLSLARRFDLNCIRGLLAAVEPTRREPILRRFPNANEL